MPFADSSTGPPTVRRVQGRGSARGSADGLRLSGRVPEEPGSGFLAMAGELRIDNRSTMNTRYPVVKVRVRRVVVQGSNLALQTVSVEAGAGVARATMSTTASVRCA